MTNMQLYSQIENLPADLKKEVLDFIEFLKSKYKKTPPTKIKERKAGIGKGYFIMKDNFDDPIEGFEEYMP